MRVWKYLGVVGAVWIVVSSCGGGAVGDGGTAGSGNSADIGGAGPGGADIGAAGIGGASRGGGGGHDEATGGVAGEQMGGWTLDWQGSTGDSAVGTNLLTAVTSVLGDDKVELQAFPGDPGNADAVLLAVREEPYAEWFGDEARGHRCGLYSSSAATPSSARSKVVMRCTQHARAFPRWPSKP